MPPLKERRKEQLAINLFDLDKLETTLRLFVTGGKLDFKRPVRVGEAVAETAIPFSCELLEAATACDVLQGELRKVKLDPVRVYLLKAAFEANWVKLPVATQFTLIHGNEVILNPQVFGRKAAQDVPAVAKKLF
jgi:hypothetical protein